MRPLTPNQRRVLDFILESIATQGYPPTLREIGARMQTRSTALVTDYLRSLERKGYVVTDPMVSRGIRVLCGVTSQVHVSRRGDRFAFVAPCAHASGAVFFPPTLVETAS